MKRVLIILLSILAVGCTDLDVTPQNGLTEAVAFSDPDSYKQYLAKLYASFILTGQDGPNGDADISIVNDEGFTSYIRSYWKAQELTTDEAIIAWTDAGIRDMHEHNWTASNQFVRVLYYRIFYTVSLCNDFIEQSSEGNLDSYGIPQENRAEIAAYREEARFLRALAYTHALDLFRFVPIFEGLGSTPLQSEPEELFGWLETELSELAESLPEPRTNQYGRADKAAVWMMQARLYLNAEVYIEQAKYEEVITAVEKVIAAGYSLEPFYADLFKADNHLSPEMIFPIVSDGTSSQNWGGTTFLVSAAIGERMSDNVVDGTEDSSEDEFEKEALTNYGVSGGWAGIRTTTAMLDKFNYGDADQDPRGIFYSNGQSETIPRKSDIGEFTAGIAVPKYINRTKDDMAGSNQDHADTDVPYFRLGDAYLMYAEATARGASNGNSATALGYINELRDRARAPEDKGDINAAPENLTTLTLSDVMDERVREMYWEGTRRMDLIRDGKFISGYNWSWKAGVDLGQDIDPYRVVFPIPQSQMETNASFKQYFSEYE
ncbi:RagB/SusD family nutrient uptake outer membrane protein [Reichenbachiella versicolor]|uniref:RagB/SusD family nutrient uptake outer membrane protein n=1 Tax=Reichenbachiella versicolor TaxID=1821036 RepID=UPI0013A56CC9|nr:RagB/SusD family nutrient uptake outer membrane protein [Reichenbachiella versicolor]